MLLQGASSSIISDIAASLISRISATSRVRETGENRECATRRHAVLDLRPPRKLENVSKPRHTCTICTSISFAAASFVSCVEFSIPFALNACNRLSDCTSLSDDLAAPFKLSPHFYICRLFTGCFFFYESAWVTLSGLHPFLPQSRAGTILRERRRRGMKVMKTSNALTRPNLMYLLGMYVCMYVCM